MVNYLFQEEIILLEELILKISGEDDEFEIRRPDDIKFIIDFVIERFENNLYRKALAYCIGIIVTHPFKNGNHRTSMICAEHFLLKNNFNSLTTNRKDKWLYKWRIKHEKKKDYDLTRMFFNIACIEDNDKKGDEIEKVMNSKYGLKIEKWLKKNYRQN